MRILLVEDDTLLGEGIRVGLRQDGYAVDWVTRGEAAEQALATDAFDLVVLDLGLPGRDGLSVLQHLRQAGDDTPVIILTARDTVADRIQGLDGGADDYLIKPFDLDELAARARALIRRSKGRTTPLLEFGRLTLDPASHQVIYKDQSVEMSPREFALLRILMENADRLVSKTRLQETLYGWDQDVESNAVEVHIHHLRKKLDAELIETVRGVGYRLAKDHNT
ncbi:MAG TPA: response regulator [Gammaproteobacteria bacterium]|nr:response regulator [Gammaproteobacteria bacterium]